MSCCGDKRAQLARTQANRVPPADTSAAPDPDPADPDPAPTPERRRRTFEYVGRGSLTVRGAVSGKVYRFPSSGDRVEVAHDDAYAMMAERDLRPTAGS